MNGQRFGALLGEALEMSTHTHYGGQRSRSSAATAVSLFSSRTSYYLSVPKPTKLLISECVLAKILKHFLIPCARY
jgi:hypothetical protein